MRIQLAAVVALAVCAGVRAGSTPMFSGVGDLAGGTNYSQVRGLSPDGKRLVGESNGAGGYVAFQMVVGGVMTPLAGLAGGGVTATAEDVTNDGVIAGYGYRTTPGIYVAFRAAAGGGVPQPLGNDTFSRAFAVSANGAVVAGDVERGTTHQGFRWTAADGIVPLGFLPGGNLSIASGISADGGTIVGVSSSDAAGNQAFRWTAAEGMKSLGAFPGGGRTSATAASDDGSVIVGFSDSAGSTRSFRWTAGTGMVNVGVPAGANYAAAFDVSGDGRVVTGYSGIFGTSTVHAFVSIDGGTPRTMEDLIRTTYHLPITGWTLTEALVNEDATVFAGIGVNPAGDVEGWVFQTPEPGGATVVVGAVGCAMSGRRRRR